MTRAPTVGLLPRGAYGGKAAGRDALSGNHARIGTGASAERVAPIAVQPSPVPGAPREAASPSQARPRRKLEARSDRWTP